MPITFQCPSCHARMSVPDQMAGKRGKCSKCKGPVLVPGPGGHATNGEKATAPAPAPAARVSSPSRDAAVRAAPPAPPAIPPADVPADVEAAAAAALADEAHQEKALEQIEFTCPQCDEPVKLPLDLGGKKHPCPNCRRIISVPMPRPSQRTNWRDKDPNLPSAARRDTEPAPEGAWGARSTTGASDQALREAGVIQAKRKPLTLLQRLRPFLLLGIPVLLVGGGWLLFSRTQSREQQSRALDYALLMSKSDKGSQQVGYAGQATLSAYLGRYYQQLGRSAGKARAEFGKVMARVEQDRQAAARRGGVDSPELDALLIETALPELKLAGTPEQVSGEERRPSAEVQKLVIATLRAVRDREARLEGLRRIAAALIEQGEAERVRPLTSQLYASADADQAEALATAGLELFRAGKKTEAEAAGRAALQPFQAKGGQPELRSAVVAIALALGMPAPKANKGGQLAVARAQIGEAAGLAWTNQPDQARQLADRNPNPDDRFRALVEIADSTRQVADVEAAIAALGPVKIKAGLAWAILRLVRVGQQAGVSAERLEPAVAAIPGPLVGWGQLALLRARLDSSRSVEPVDGLDRIAPSLAREVARVELAWHNTRRSRTWERTMQDWKDGPRAFGSVGVALGLQGGR